MITTPTTTTTTTTPSVEIGPPSTVVVPSVAGVPAGFKNCVREGDQIVWNSMRYPGRKLLFHASKMEKLVRKIMGNRQ